MDSKRFSAVSGRTNRLILRFSRLQVGFFRCGVYLVRLVKNVTNDFTNVFLDIDGNKNADMTIRLTGLIILDASDFIL